MRPLTDYALYIFDCDGVILDSNRLKIDAIGKAVATIEGVSESKVAQCRDYFANNFGLSRFHHIEYFIEHLLDLKTDDKKTAYNKILTDFGVQCRRLYMQAELTPHIIDFLQSLKGYKYVASGSQQDELRDIFKARNLTQYFDEIFGSPTKKQDIIARILQHHHTKNALMLGDAVSDFTASEKNGIDFVFYQPFSTVPKKMQALAQQQGFKSITDFSQLE